MKTTVNSSTAVLEDSDSGEYSDPSVTDSSDEAEDPYSATTEDLIFLHSLRVEREIPRSTSRILALHPGLHPIARERSIKRIIRFSYYFQLTSDALHSAVTYFDIVLSTVQIPEPDLELLATVCYWLAAKVDSRAKPAVDDINTAAGTTYTLEMMRDMEIRIVTALGFQLSYPTAKMFLRRFIEKSGATETVADVANILVEVALIKLKFVDVQPSVTAASAVAVSWAAFGNTEASKWVVRLSFARDRQLLGDCMRTMVVYCERIAAAKDAIEKHIQIHTLFESMDLSFDVDSLL
jgi:hypothetical protein